jgi:hypothetical protein
LLGLVDELERPELLAVIHRLIRHQLSEQTVAQEDLRQLLPAVLAEQLALVLAAQAVRGQPHPLTLILAVVVARVDTLVQVVLVLSALPEVTVLAAVRVAVLGQVVAPLAAVVLGCWVLEQVVQALQIILLVAVEVLGVKQVLG